MKLSTILTTFCISAFALTGAAQTHGSKAKSVHERMHRQQLASVKTSKMDRTVISDILKNDVAARESEAVAKANAENEILVADLLKEANRHIGKPYRHGMKGPNAFDCSGFSSYVYKQFGYKISPSSRTQYTEGESVDRKSLKKGDLVFFTSRRSGKNVGHVGIVVSADNETGDFSFIHASVKGVKIDKYEGYYRNRYVGARRIIND